MIKQEFEDCINELAQAYRGFSLTPHTMNRWFERLKKFDKSQVWKAIDNWVYASLKAPTLSDIEEGAVVELQKAREKAKGFYGSRTDEELENLPSVIAFRKTSKIEFCMDVLGVETVNQEIKSIVGPDAKWSDLLARSDWVPLYKAKLQEMFLTAAEFDPVQFRKRFKDLTENVQVISFIEKTEVRKEEEAA